jgi:threonine synthase
MEGARPRRAPRGGASLAALGRGFDLLRNLGWIEGPEPRISGAQPSGVAPVVRAFERNAPIEPWGKIDTIAQSLAIARPADGEEAIQRIRQSRGRAVSAPDEAIREGIRLLARSEGIYTEPAGGTAVAALVTLAESGFIARDETVVLNITGNGLKTPQVLRFERRPPIACKSDALDRELARSTASPTTERQAAPLEAAQ